MDSPRPPWRRFLYGCWLRIVDAWLRFRWRLEGHFQYVVYWWPRSSLGGILRLPFVALHRLSFGIGNLLYRWWMTRRLRLLLEALPAVLFLIATGILLYLVVV